jgi:hypothetical protein
VAARFSLDGRSLLVQGWASDISAKDFNQTDDVFVLAFLYAAIVPSPAIGQGPTLTWPVRPGESYHVQFKDTLADLAWREAAGEVTVAGTQAQFTDLAPSFGPRFYRVQAY